MGFRLAYVERQLESTSGRLDRLISRITEYADSLDAAGHRRLAMEVRALLYDEKGECG